MTSDEQPGAATASGCELCDAARTTEWFHEDDLCWVAECESCFVPMVVWKRHDPAPSAEIKIALLDTLAAVVSRHFEMECWFDDNMRNIPDHYHAHARPRGGFFGHGVRRRSTS